MVFGLFRRKNSNEAIVGTQYEAITEAARRPLFYSDMNAPDTVMGRFDLVTIHMMLYLRAIKDADESVKQLAQEVVDAFFVDIDHSIRELGIGDAGVPKRMKKLARMFYGRAEAYGEALDNNDQDALEAALARNIYPETKDEIPSLGALADYLLKADKVLKDVNRDDMVSGRLAFPQIEN